MNKYSSEFFKKSFQADDMKSAYLLAVKWFSTNVLSKAEFLDVSVQFVKEDKTEFPTITIHLFAGMNENEVFAQHCKCCEEMHKSFFINENNNCNICAAKGFHNRIDQDMFVKRDWYRQLLRKYGGME